MAHSFQSVQIKRHCFKKCEIRKGTLHLFLVNFYLFQVHRGGSGTDDAFGLTAHSFSFWGCQNNESGIMRNPFTSPAVTASWWTWAPDSKTGSRRPCRCHILEHWNPGKPMVYTGRTDSRKPVISRQWKCQAAHRSNLKN